jgi:hypothetical protein
MPFHFLLLLYLDQLFDGFTLMGLCPSESLDVKVFDKYRKWRFPSLLFVACIPAERLQL